MFYGRKFSLYYKIITTMDKQTLWMIIVAALLLFVWLPALVISVRKTLRKNKMNHNKTK